MWTTLVFLILVLIVDVAGLSEKLVYEKSQKTDEFVNLELVKPIN